MAAIGDCGFPGTVCNPTVNIPGSAGAPGNPGTNGVNAFSTIASFQGVGFTVPNVGSSAQVYITDTGEWMGLNQLVYISGAGQYQVTATASVGINGTSVQVKNLGTAGNAIPGSVISAGNTISPSGAQGLNAFSITTATFAWTTYGTSSNITCSGLGNSVAWMAPGQIVFVQNAGYFQVNGSPNVVTGTASLTLLQYAGNNQNGSVAPGAQVSPGGVQGSLPLPLPQTFFSNALSANISNAFTNVGTAQVTLPAAGTWVVFSRLLVRISGQITASPQPQITAQLETQVSGAGSFTLVPNSVTNPKVSCNTTYTGGGSLVTAQDMMFNLPATIYQTATIGDVIGIFAEYTTAATNTMVVIEASVVATCLNLNT